MRTIKLYGGDFGSEMMLVRCDLSQASAPIEVDYCSPCDETNRGYETTQYQCADAAHSINGLVRIGKQLAAVALEMPEVDCEWEEVEGVDLLADGKVSAIATEGTTAIYRGADGQAMICHNWGSYSPVPSECEDGDEFTSDDGVSFVVRDGQWQVENH